MCIQVSFLICNVISLPWVYILGFVVEQGECAQAQFNLEAIKACNMK